MMLFISPSGEGCWQQRAAGVLWPCSCSISVPCSRERMHCYLQPRKASGPKLWSLLCSVAGLCPSEKQVRECWWCWSKVLKDVLVLANPFLSGVAVLSKPVQNSYTPAKENEITSPCSAETKRQRAAVERLDRGERGPCTTGTAQRQQKTLGCEFFSVVGSILFGSGLAHIPYGKDKLILWSWKPCCRI